MAAGKIEYAFLKLWLITDDNVIGPTTNTTLRGSASLPRPGSATSNTDPNTIYLDVAGGSDVANGQSFAASKKTLLGADAVTTGTRNTIHIRTSSGTHSVINLTASYVSNTNTLIIQVHPGQTATVYMADGTNFLMGSGASSVNGFELNGTDLGSLLRLYTGSSANFMKVVNPSGSGLGSTNILGAATLTVNNTWVEAALIGINPGGSTDNTLTGSNNVLVRLNNATAFDYAAAIEFTSNNEDITLNISHFTIVGWDRVLNINGTPGPALVTITNNHSHIIDECQYGGYYDGVSGVSNIPFLNSLIRTSFDTYSDYSSATNVLNENPLFLNTMGYDFRLMHVGRTYAGMNYPATSPAFQLGTSSSEAGAYQMTATLDSETNETMQFDDGVGWEYRQLTPTRVNYTEVAAIDGFTEISFDEVKSSIALKLPERYFTDDLFSDHLHAMLYYRSFMKYWPRGTDPDYEGSGSIDIGESTFTFSPTLDGAILGKTKIGWIVEVTWDTSAPGSFSGWYRIADHTGDLFTLTYISGDVLTAGDPDPIISANLAIFYFPCNLGMAEIVMTSEYTGEDESEGVFKPGTPDGEEISRYHTREIRLLEARHPVEEV